jgi:succinate dehydrogenase/fumarate reductase flavoprotein subunit
MPKEEFWSERYFRLLRELDGLYQRRKRELSQRINAAMRKTIQKELDAMEDAVKKEDIIDALRHQMILEVLLK